jgi:hypothetical protein
MYTVQYGGNIAEYFAAAAEDYRRATTSKKNPGLAAKESLPANQHSEAATLVRGPRPNKA